VHHLSRQFPKEEILAARVAKKFAPAKYNKINSPQIFVTDISDHFT